MDKIKASKSQMQCALAMAIIVVGYAVERVISIAFNPEKTAGLIMAIVYTALLAVVYFLIAKSKDYFSGLLAAMLGYKMMPPTISALDSTSLDGSMLYFIVKKAAVVIFILLILKFYELQEKPRAIMPVPILAVMVLVPFFTSISDKLGTYLVIETGTLLYSFFVQYACYAIATVVMVVIAYRNNYESMVFVAYFEYLALLINILRRATVIIVHLAAHEHISRSYYVWLVVYVGLMAFVALAKNKKKKEINA